MGKIFKNEWFIAIASVVVGVFLATIVFIPAYNKIKAKVTG